MVKEGPKRSYNKIPAEDKIQLIYRACVMGHQTSRAARVLKLSYPTAKVIVHKYSTQFNKLAHSNNIVPLNLK